MFIPRPWRHHVHRDAGGVADLLLMETHDKLI